MRIATFSAILAAAFALVASPPLQAMGFGKTALATTLGQRLDFSAAIALDADEQLARECVFAEVHVGDALLPPPAVRVTLENTGEGNGSRRVRVTSSTLIDEPVVTVEVSVGCNSRMSRRFVVFIDPPQINLAEAPAAMPAQAGREPVVSAIVDAARNGARRSRSAFDEAGGGNDAVAQPRAEARTSPRTRRVASAAAALAPRSSELSPTDSPRRTATNRRSAAPAFAAAPARGSPRLQLDAARAPAAPPRVAAASAPGVALTAMPSTATLPAATATTAAASAASLTPELAVAAAAAALAPHDADSAALAKERERIQILEAGLAQLRAESQANQQSLLTLQARLREAESDRYANGLVYALAAGLLFFAALSAAFWALRPRQRRRARWFDAEANQKKRAARNPAPAVRPAAPERDSASLDLQDTPSWRGGAPSALNTAPATIGGLEVTTVLGPESARPSGALPAANSAGLSNVSPFRRADSQSMEALIDLEQQVEFFTVLGQDEAAISLLEAHVHGAGSTSPLPYLTLLELHQRRRDKPAFEVVRAAFYERFGVDAPAWLTGLHTGRDIAGYPPTLARLQSLWSTPLHAMQALDGLLFRRSEIDEGFGFDFPAYRDLLFLYAVARDLAGNVDTDLGSIDLFLPLGDAAQPAPAEAGDTGFFAVDLDVTDWDEGEPPENLVILRAPGRHGAG